MHCHWRSCKDWNGQGLPLSTTSDEACKMYDATLTQYVGWYDDQSVGGLENSAQKILEADPEFLMGHVMNNGLELMGTGRSPRLDTGFQSSLDKMAALLQGGREVTPREALHVKAVQLCGQGYMSEACDVWENILVNHPQDMLALKFAHDCYFYLGYQPQMRDSIARVIPQWKPTIPLYGYLMGMHSFGLCETNLYSQAEKVARKGLEINARDPWSTHSLAHVLEMEGRQMEGITFMSSTVNDWSPCGMLACHNFWHWAVYHIERGEYQGAVDIYDAEVATRANKSGAMLDIVDACSMLYRLEMEGVDVGSRWQELSETCAPHLDDHLLAFNDAHLLMSYLRAGKTDVADKFMDSLKDFVNNGHGTNHKITKEVGLPLCEAFQAYNSGKFDQTVDILSPLKYQIVTIGGSNAQRDVFSQFLIHAALKSSKPEHHQLARHLLTERKALKENAPMTDRLIAKAMACHVH